MVKKKKKKKEKERRDEHIILYYVIHYCLHCKLECWMQLNYDAGPLKRDSKSKHITKKSRISILYVYNNYNIIINYHSDATFFSKNKKIK